MLPETPAVLQQQEEAVRTERQASGRAGGLAASPPPSCHLHEARQ